MGLVSLGVRLDTPHQFHCGAFRAYAPVSAATPPAVIAHDVFVRVKAATAIFPAIVTVETVLALGAIIDVCLVVAASADDRPIGPVIVVARRTMR